ncbi:TOMM precursor leader peptide-binding protein, partial [Streptomyces sp. SID8361]|nr:TOMM precursor leader peptide-binding protein [Streptomyces sp. SID8361]
APLVLGSADPGEVVRALRAAGLRTAASRTVGGAAADRGAVDGDPTVSGAATPRREICQIAPRQHGDTELTLVVCDDYLDPRLAAVDAAHRAAGLRWLPVKPVGTQAWLGPFLGAPDDPCWVCLADRLWRGRQAEAYLQRRLGRPGPVPRPPASLPA